MKAVAVLMMIMMCLAGCVSESEPLPEKDAPEPIVTEGWDNQSHQFWNVQPMSVENLSEMTFNNTGFVNVTIQISAFFHEPLLWEQGHVEYSLEYNNETVFNHTMSLGEENLSVNLSNVSGNITIRIQSTGSDDEFNNEPGDFFIARTEYTMTSS